jgi:hypothetical protein
MGEVTESAFETISEVRVRALPSTVFGESNQRRKIVGAPQLFERQVRQRRRGLADSETGVSAALEQKRLEAGLPRHQGHHAGGETGADNRNIAV